MARTLTGPAVLHLTPCVCDVDVEVGLPHPALRLLTAHPEQLLALDVLADDGEAESSTAFGRTTTRVASSLGFAARAAPTSSANGNASSLKPLWVTTETSKTR